MLMKETQTNNHFIRFLMSDLDGDGKPDMIVVDNDNELYLLRQYIIKRQSLSFAAKVSLLPLAAPLMPYMA